LIKGYLIGILIFFMPVLNLYSQNVEKISYLDIGPDGSQRINRTVNVVFAGWSQMEVKREGNFRVTYQWLRLVDGEWSDRELTERRPMQGTLTGQYDALLRDHALFPNASSIIQIGRGINVLRMFDIPVGQTRPIWLSTDGNSFFMFYKMYVIVN